MNRKGSGDQQPFFAPIPVPPVRPAVRRPLNPDAIPYVPLAQRQSRAYMYTPFANEDSLKSALGENMVRIRKGKQAHGVLAPSHKMADNLEAIRQQRLQEWGGAINQANQTLNSHAQRGREQDALLLDRIKRITDHNKGSPLANMKLKASQIKKQQFALDTLNTEKIMAQSDLACTRSALPRYSRPAYSIPRPTCIHSCSPTRHCNTWHTRTNSMCWDTAPRIAASSMRHRTASSRWTCQPCAST